MIKLVRAVGRSAAILAITGGAGGSVPTANRTWPGGNGETPVYPVN